MTTGSVISSVPRLKSRSLSSITWPLMDPRTTNMTRVGSTDSVRFSCCGAGVVDLEVAVELVVVEGAGDAAAEVLSVMVMSRSLSSCSPALTSVFFSASALSSLSLTSSFPSASTDPSFAGTQRSLASILQTTVSE